MSELFLLTIQSKHQIPPARLLIHCINKTKKVLLTYTKCIGADLVLKKVVGVGEGMFQVTDMYFFILKGK